MSLNIEQVNAIYKLHPQAIVIRNEIAYDAQGNEVAYDLQAVNAKVSEMQAEEEAKTQAAEAKLAKLGLTTDDLKALLGK